MGLIFLRNRVSGGAPPAFDPASLFASGEDGVWYDPSDLTTMWTDTAGTTQTTAVLEGVTPTSANQVARIDDKSGNGNHALQGTSPAQPILRVTSGGLYYLEFDGTDDFMSVAYTTTFNNITRSAAYRAAASNIFLDEDNVANRGSFWTTTTNGNLRFYNNASGIIASGGWSHNVDEVVVGTINSSGAATIDGSGNSQTGTVSVPSIGGIRLGSGGSGANWLDGRIYAVVDLDRVVTAQENTNLQTYLANRSGVTL